MVRYYFHIIDGIFQADPTGEELDTLALAQQRAIVRAMEAITAQGDSFWKDRPIKIAVTDVSGSILFDVTVAGRTY